LGSCGDVRLVVLLCLSSILELPFLSRGCLGM